MKNEALFSQRSHRLPCTNSFVHLKQIIPLTIKIFREAAGGFIKQTKNMSTMIYEFKHKL